MKLQNIGKPELSTKLITGRASSYGLEIGVDSLWITGGKVIFFVKSISRKIL